jgi:cell division protein FtsX
MDLSTLIVVIVGTLLFIGFAVWGAFSSRRNKEADEQIEAE